MKTIYLNFFRKDLLYDLANIGWVEGDVMPTDDEHRRHNVQDIIEDGNRDRVTRMLNLYFAQVVEFLYLYTKQEVADESDRDDKFQAPRRYVIRMSVPDTFSSTTHKYLEELIHNYIIARVLHDWLSITYPEVAAKWQMKAEELKEEIKDAISNRTKVMLRKMRPF